MQKELRQRESWFVIIFHLKLFHGTGGGSREEYMRKVSIDFSAADEEEEVEELFALRISCNNFLP